MTSGGLFRLPVSFAEALGLYEEEKKSDEDQAADLDYIGVTLENYISNVTSPSTVPTFGESLDHGKEAQTMAGTTLTTNAVFTASFSTAPRLVLSLECGRGQDLRVLSTAVTSAGFTYKVTAPSSSTTTLLVHWVAIET